VCCRMKKGKLLASIRKSAARCKNATACGASLGLYSTFDACNTTGTCAQEATTTTTPTVTTTTVPPPLGCGAERAAFEASLPVPTLGPSGYVVQLVNESYVTLLAAANAAHKVGQPPFPVLPREGTWVIPPMGVLTIDIPLEWQGTVGKKEVGGALGPVLWARTGCRYDIAHDIAQCETGPCSGFYDCSKALQTASGPKALAEWTFNDPNNNFWSFPDISVVDGVNLNMDIQPVGGTNMPNNPKWLNHPLVKCGGDQRDLLWCPPRRFQLRRSDLKMFIAGSPGGDELVGCFSNCGLYTYPVAPLNTCNYDPATDPRCYYWKTFCAQFPAGQYVYDIPCTDNANCTQHGACWDNGNASFKCVNPPPGGGGPKCCALTAFNKQPNCPATQCTFPYEEGKQNQPPFGLCSDVTAATGDPDACIGDDTFHYVMPYGLTWPNDPEVFSSDAHIFRIIFQPGGTNLPITDAGPPPMCSDLPPAYNYQKALMDCSGVANKVFASAVLSTATNPNWACNVTNAAIPDGVLCRW
jgi:Thaumatin family